MKGKEMETQMTDTVELSTGESASRSYLIAGTIAAASMVWQQVGLFRRRENRIQLGRAKALALMMCCWAMAAPAQPVICSLNPATASIVYNADVPLQISVQGSSITLNPPDVLFNGNLLNNNPYPVTLTLSPIQTNALVAPCNAFVNATIPIGDLVSALGSAGIVTVQVQVGNSTSASDLSQPLYFIVTGSAIDPSQVANGTVLNSGQIAAQVATGSAPNLSAVFATLTDSGVPQPHQVSVTVANYSDFPIPNFPALLWNSGSSAGFFDVQVVGATTADSLTVQFTYPSQVTGTPTLQYLDTSVAPASLTDVSPVIPGSGTFTVTFNATSVPTITQLSGTIFFTGRKPEDPSLLSVESQLTALRGTVTDPQVGGKLDIALKALAASAYPPLWIDPLHLQPKTGEKVFREEKDAVEILSDLIQDQASGLNYATLANWISLLVAADRGIAQTALNEAQAAGGDPNKLLQAANQIAEGDTDAPKHSADAIADYGSTWKKATSK